MSASLFDPIRLGAVDCPNRILMAPLTRARATRDFVPTPLMATYYAQRAGAGLIISEATAISRQGMSWPFAPGLWSDEQVTGWRRVTDAVHAAGGRIVAQLWHMGRLVHPSFLDGARPVSSSAIAAPGEARTYDGRQSNVVPAALDQAGIAALIGDYRAAARHALAAGFDGVQIHSANGYLLDQFLRDSVNRRDDGYGGTVANRCRLLREVVAAVCAEAGAERTAVRLSTTGAMQGVEDSDTPALFTQAVADLAALGLAFLELREPGPDSTFHGDDSPKLSPQLRPLFPGPLVLNSDYTQDDAAAALRDGGADAISFGRPFIANPDLPRRFADRLPLSEADKATFYTQDARGYTDHPTFDEQLRYPERS